MACLPGVLVTGCGGVSTDSLAFSLGSMNDGGLHEPDSTDLTLPVDDRRELIAWAAECIHRLLPVFAEHRPGDPRLRDALLAVEGFRTGTISVAPMRQLAFGCHDAARDCDAAEPAAVARACGQAIAIAHMGGHARNLERYTRKALNGQSLVEELAWQHDHLPARLTRYVYEPPPAKPKA